MPYWVQRLTGVVIAIGALFLVIYWSQLSVVGPLQRVIENQQRIQRGLAIMCEYDLRPDDRRCEELEAYNADVLKRRE